LVNFPVSTSTANRLGFGVSRLPEKTRRLLSGVQSEGISLADEKVMRLTVPPVEGTTKMSKFPKRVEANAIHLPSGEKTG